MSYDWPGIVALLLWVSAGGFVFIARNWILARVTNSVQHHFNVQLENVRADLRDSEERVKSELRNKEAEIAALRANVLSGSANRQSLLDKRRFEAVERVWAAVNELAPLKMLNGMLAVLNMAAISKEAHDPKMQRFLSTIGTTLPPVGELKNSARDEQPFLPGWPGPTSMRTAQPSRPVTFGT